MQDDEEEEDAEMVSQDATPTPQDVPAGNLFNIYVEEDCGSLNFIRLLGGKISFLPFRKLE